VIRRRADYDVGYEMVQRQYGATEPEQRTVAPTSINLPTAEMLREPRRFIYGGRLYVMEKLEWLDGIAMEHIVNMIPKVMGENVNRMELIRLRDLYLDGIEIMWRNVKVTGRWRRLLRWLGLLRNPFLNVTNGEFHAIATFCLECRMKLPNLALDSSPGRDRRANLRRVTSPMKSVNLRMRTPRGFGRTGSLSATITSS
jgi:hypothetical protein